MVPTQYGCDWFYSHKVSQKVEGAVRYLRDSWDLEWLISRQKCLLESLFLSGLRRGLSRSQHYTLVSTMLFYSWQRDTSLTHLSSFVKWVSRRYLSFLWHYQTHLSRTQIWLFYWRTWAMSHEPSHEPCLQQQAVVLCKKSSKILLKTYQPSTKQ